MTGHTYRYFQGEPLYAFGYGMSYTKFSYTDLIIPDTMKTQDSIHVSVQVQNTGGIKGDEVIQLYVKDVEAQVSVPIWSLQGFQRITLEPGESRRITFKLIPKQFSLINDSLERVVEPGKFIIAVGGGLPEHSAETTEVLTKSIMVEGDPFIVDKLYWEN
jgi:beta-glucosidase